MKKGARVKNYFFFKNKYSIINSNVFQAEENKTESTELTKVDNIYIFILYPSIKKKLYIFLI